MNPRHPVSFHLTHLPTHKGAKKRVDAKLGRGAITPVHPQLMMEERAWLFVGKKEVPWAWPFWESAKGFWMFLDGLGSFFFLFIFIFQYLAMLPSFWWSLLVARVMHFSRSKPNLQTGQRNPISVCRVDLSRKHIEILDKLTESTWKKTEKSRS